MIVRNMLILMIICELTSSAEISYNLPNLSACAEWNPVGITFAGEPMLIFGPDKLFIDQHNTIYVADIYDNHLYEWYNNSNSPTRIISDDLNQPYGMFVSSVGDIYINDGYDGQVNKWKATTNSFETATKFCQICHALFISINDMMYCSMESYNQIVTKSLHNNLDVITIVAGVGIPGSEAHMLHAPSGIFVNIDLDLYVADLLNDRIQLFRSGEIDGTTIVGTSDTFQLSRPASVVLDANNYIYIVDMNNHRIVSGTSRGFQCIVACSGDGASSYRLNSPFDMAFDSFGNIYVTDRMNMRVQKFLLSKNTCDNADTIKLSTISTSTTDVPTVIFNSAYMSTFLTTNPVYFEQCNPVYHGNAQMLVSKHGYYEFIINSTVGINAKIYKNNFNPLNPNANLLLHSYGECIIGQIKFTIQLWPTEIYYLLVTTTSSNAASSFSVIASGSSRTSFNQTNILKIVQTEYSSELTVNSPKCSCRDDCKLLNWYCDIIEINTIEEGYYIIMSNSTLDLSGYIYENNFTLLNLAKNEIAGDDNSHCNYHFKIELYRPVNSSFILIVTTNRKRETGNFSIIVYGSGNISMNRLDNMKSIIQTNYSSQLNNQSQKFSYHNCYSFEFYYEALQINVNTSDYYMFSSDSSLDTYGYLYQYSFDPYNSMDISLVQNDNSCEDTQFQVTAYLQSNVTYILVVTTSYIDVPSNRQGSFSVIAQGPDKIDIKQMNDFSRITIVQSMYSLEFTRYSPQYGDESCQSSDFSYESIQINVIQSGNYTLSSVNNVNTRASLYEQHFNPYSPSERLLYDNFFGCPQMQFKIVAELLSNLSYILITEIPGKDWIGELSVLGTGPNNVIFKKISLQITYTSELTKETPVYSRDCTKRNFHYEAIEINVQQNGSYTFDGNASILLYGYIYRNDFDPLYPHKNVFLESSFNCSNRFKLGNYLEVNVVYILVITTFEPNVRGSFTLFVTGPNNITLNRLNKKYSSCIVGAQCDLHKKGIGLTINDILRDQIQSNISFGKQSVLIHVAASITMIMFVIDLINSIFSLITFKNKELRIVGCGSYLLASSITSLLTITMFTVKFWFVVLIQLHSIIRSSILRVDCIFLSPVLKLCLYLDGWLNACVAIERTVNVSKGVNFDKKMSKRVARWIIPILVTLITCTIIHEPIRHELFEYTTQKYKSINNNLTMNISIETEHNVLCIIRYSRSLQIYNTVTLFVHLIVPFLANLCSALFIIFATARQRSITQRNQTFKKHVFKQMSEHKQLLISSFILLILAMPRLIISLISGCVDPSNNPWLYLSAYFISFTPPMLIFIVFVLPSELYRKTFKKTMLRS